MGEWSREWKRIWLAYRINERIEQKQTTHNVPGVESKAPYVIDWSAIKELFLI